MSEITKFKMSLRMRVTLITGTTLVVICLLLSFTILYNAQNFIIGPSINVSELNQPDVMGPTVNGDTVNSGTVTSPVVPDQEKDAIMERSTNNILDFYTYTIIAIIIVLIAGILLLYMVTGLSLNPVKQLQKDIASIDAGDLSKRISDFSAGDELDALAKSFNQMLDRIQNAFEREKSFSAGAAHELKTPLAVMKTNVEVLQMLAKPTPEQTHNTIEVVKKQTERMIKLVNDLFSMCALNGYEITESIPLDKLLSEVIDEHRDSAKERNIQIEIHSMACQVKGNTVMLKHAMSNIIQNAIKYNRDGGSVHIAISETGEQCKIRISDTGIGIAANAADHIFEPFYREDKSRSRKIGGAGLGLSIVKSVMEQHGGTVIYVPNTPRGSVFEVTLPRL